MSPEDAEEYTQSLGQIVAGSWRQVALGRRLGVPQALGLSVEDWVQNRLGGYVRLSIPERREAVRELTSADGGALTIRGAAEVLGVGVATVMRDREAVPFGTAEAPLVMEMARPVVPNGTAEATFLNGLMTLRKLTFAVERAGGIGGFVGAWDHDRRARYAASFAELRATLERWEAICLGENDGD